MKKDSIIDYLGYIFLKLFGPPIRSLPLGVSLFLGRRLGEFFYYFDNKHRAIVYANIKTAFTGKLTPAQINNLTKEFYQSFGQNVIEVLLIPLVDKAYINKYITLEGTQHIREGFRKGKGVILLAVHEGSWELSNVLCANLDFPFSLFIRQQRYPRLDKILNAYRRQKGCKIIQRENQARGLIEVLKNNEAIGMTADQGGKSGILVKFFGKSASMPSGAIRLALKYDTAIIPAFYTRISGPYVKVFLGPPFEIIKTGDLEKDIRDNLQRIVAVFEKYILQYPKEYLWVYKIWKYAREKTILILSDGKTGHLRQSQALAQMIKNYLKEKGIAFDVHSVEIKFKNKFSKFALNFSSCLAGGYRCQGCLWCLETFLAKDTSKPLINIKPDIVISCGSSIAPINYVISRENLAKSIVLMRPSILSTARFNLVVMSRHDRPPKRKNVTVIEGALNLIDEDSLKEQQEKLKTQVLVNKELVLGLLLGGDSKVFHLGRDLIKEIVAQLKQSLEKLDAQVLITTSRRTPKEAEQFLKKEFQDYPRCKLLIIANEKNIPAAIPGILAFSKIVVTSPESISMISEAVNSKRYVLVFNSPKLGTRHARFLKHFAKNKYIYTVEADNLSEKIEEVWLKRPQVHSLKDELLVNEAIKKIL